MSPPQRSARAGKKKSAKRSGRIPTRALGKTAAVAQADPRRFFASQLPGPTKQDGFSEVPPPGQVRLVWGRSGDHAAIYHMLLAVFQGPSREEFHAQTEDPFYEPTDRLLVKRGYRVLAHVHLTRRAISFGGMDLPIGGLHELCTLPEFRDQGFGRRLLAEAEARMIAEGAALGFLRTKIPRFFRPSGWAVCGRHCVSQAKPNEVVARLNVEPTARSARPLNIRLWRHVEMPALVRLYKQNAASAYGPCERTEAYWRWLVGRKAYDALLVALDGPDKLELEETIAPIVGYAVLRQGHIVELCTAPDHPTADYQLLARACADAIEHDRQQIFLHAPPTSRLHPIVASANGRYIDHESAGEEVFMVKIFEPPKFLDLLAAEFDARAKVAGLPRDVELGLSVEGAKWRLVCTRRGFRVRGGGLGRNFLILNRAEFTRLALGHAKVRDTAETGRIIASTKVALDLADALFPRLAFWRPYWDELPA